MSKKKILIKILIFTFIVAVIWYPVQRVISFKWDTTIEKLAARYEEISKEPKDTIDVLFLGSSPTYEDYVPAEIYNRTGITSINMGTSNNRAMTEYYGLLYALKYQTPKVLVMDMVELREIPYEDYSARDFVENMPDIKIKLETIKAINDEYDEADVLGFFVPLLHYHARWDELAMKDFKYDTDDRIYEPYLKGNFMVTKIEPQEEVDDLLMDTEVEIPQDQFRYYDRILEVCREYGIKPVISLPPRYDMTISEYEAIYEYAEKNDIIVWDQMSPDVLAEIGIDPARHYFDNAHLNIEGARLYSDYIAEQLRSVADLKDHRGETGYESWDETYRLYDEAYQKMMSEELGQ